jgi:iron complex transport system substrate-binding protein
MADSRPIYALAAAELLELPNVGSARNFNLEACLALKPDLVILPLRLRESADILAELKIPVIVVNPENQKSLFDFISLIGDAADAKPAAEKLISYYNEEMRAIAALTKNLRNLPRVYLGGPGNYLTTMSNEMLQAALVNSAGGINAAAELQGDYWITISYEQLLAMNPDVIIIPAEASYTKKDILSDIQLSELTAIKEGKVYQMPRAFEAWDSPVPSSILGMKWMLYALHEPVYSLDSLRTEAAAFYREFFGIEIDSSLIEK